MVETYLPFRNGTYVQVTQGNRNTDPNATHHSSTNSAWAYDFNLAAGDIDEGSEIVAASAGIVAKIKEDTPNDWTGESQRGKQTDNHIVLALPDGTCDAYLHIQQNSVSEAALTVGSQVARGQRIARLGKTGYCFGAHLHFQRQKCGQGHCGPFPCTQNRIQPSIQLVFPEFGVPYNVPSTDHVSIAGRWFTSRNTPQASSSLKDALQANLTQRASSLLLPASSSFAAMAQQQALGAALSAVRKGTAPSGQAYAYQVFEGDTLYLPLDPAGETNWNDVRRMTDLLRPIAPAPGYENDWESFRQTILALAQPANRLARWLWEQTYANAGLTFNDKWASHWFALGQAGAAPLGAPLGGGPQAGQYLVTVGGTNYWAELYARDAIYWPEGQYRNIQRLSAL